MSSVRHILMTADTIGGVWTYSLELSEALARRGVCVSLATMGNKLTQEQRAEADRIDGLEIYESSYKLEWMDDPWSDVDRAGDWLLGLEQRIQPDVVHLNGYAHAALSWTAPVAVVAHSCVLSWFEAVRHCPAPSGWDTYRERVQAGLEAADIVISVTHAMSRALERWYGPVASSRVIHNGRNPQLYAPGNKDESILSCGRIWDEAKNISGLESVAALLPWPIYIAGEQQHPSGGKRAIEYLRPLGFLPPDQLRRWFSRASIFALPARYEPFGLSALEAALSGCTLVLSDIPSLREVWGGAALFVPPDDPSKLALALNLLALDKLSLDLWARRARDRALTLTSERMADQYLHAYAAICAVPGTVEDTEASCAS
jgi:glycosyltransferase involved in cell wall biosynthesis